MTHPWPAIKEALLRARKDGNTQRKIAKDIKCSPGNLYELVAREGTQSEFYPALSAWMVEHGYLEDLPAAPTSTLTAKLVAKDAAIERAREALAALLAEKADIIREIDAALTTK